MTEHANPHNNQDSQNSDQQLQEQAPASERVSAGQPASKSVSQPAGQPISQSQSAGQQQISSEQAEQLTQAEQQTPPSPITPKVEQPQQAMQQQLDQQSEQHPNQQTPQQNNDNQQPQNPQWSFLRPAGQGDSAEFTLLSRVGWFALGFVGGFFGMLGAWLLAGSLPANRRRQAVNTTWIGFLCQAILVLIYMLMGGAFPFAPTGTTQTSTTQSTSAFG